MRSFYARGVLVLLGVFCLADNVRGQYGPYNGPQMMPAAPMQQRFQPTGFRVPQQTYRPAGYGGYGGQPGFYMAAQPGEQIPAPAAESSLIPSPSDHLLTPQVPQQQYAPAPQPQYQPQPQPYVQPTPYTQSTPYDAAMSSGWAGNSSCISGSCAGGGYGGQSSYGGYAGGCGGDPYAYGQALGYGAPTCGCWYGTANGLIMNRNNPNDRWLSYSTANPSYHLLNSNDASMNASGGFETRVGRYFNCGWNAIEGSYWGVFPGSESACVYEYQLGGGALGTTLPLDSLRYYVGNNAYDVLDAFNNAAAHHVSMRSEFQNVELNLLGFNYGASAYGGGFGGGCGGGGWNNDGYGGCSTGGCASGGCYSGGCSSGSCGSGGCGSCCNWGPAGPGFCCNGCSRMRWNWVAGVRYFRFKESFQYASSLNDNTLGNDGDDLYYNIQTVNNLVGFQLGGRGEYCLGRCFSAYGGTKFGIYGNHISQNQRIYNSQENARINEPASPYNGQAYLVDSNKNDVAFLGEADLGLTYRFSRCWSANMGYRVVAVTGVALTSNQFPVYYSDLADARAIDSNGSLILHGAYAGLNYNW